MTAVFLREFARRSAVIDRRYSNTLVVQKLASRTQSSLKQRFESSGPEVMIVGEGLADVQPSHPREGDVIHSQRTRCSWLVFIVPCRQIGNASVRALRQDPKYLLVCLG